MLLAPIVWVLTVVVMYFFAAKVWWFPPPINQHGLAYDAQFMRTLVITGFIFFLAQFALGWVIFRYRDDGKRASYSHGNNKLEALWTTATAVLFVGIVLIGTKIWVAVHLAEPDPNAMQIELMAKQFAFAFRYPGPDGKFGSTDLKQVNDAAGNPFGLVGCGSGRQGRYRERIVESARWQAHQADHALARRDSQFLRARTAFEAGYRARHGDPALFPGGSDRHLRDPLLGIVRPRPFSNAQHHASNV